MQASIELVAYCFNPDESIHAGVKRIVTEEVNSAVDQLEGRGKSDRDAAIHEARKSVKKVRGVLKLLRPELGAIYATENQRFRDLGGQLSEFRDAGAMLEAFDQLSSHYRDEWGRRHSMRSVRSRLRQAKASHESDASLETVLAAVSHELRSAGVEVKRWPLQEDGFAALAPGLKRTYRAGRSAMAKTFLDPSDVNYHDWRKRVKDHWYHVRLIDRGCGGTLRFYQKTLKDLEGSLGDDHNLVVLSARISAQPEVYGTGSEVALFLQTLQSYQQRLRSTAALLGKSVYEEKPSACIRSFRSLWAAWVKDRERTNLSLPVTGLSGCET